jgi:hypothetical protein
VKQEHRDLTAPCTEHTAAVSSKGSAIGRKTARAIAQAPRRSSRGETGAFGAKRNWFGPAGSLGQRSVNGMVRPCSCPASKRSSQGAPKTRSTPCLRHPIRDRRDGHRYRQELVPRRGPRCVRRHRAAAKVVAWPSGSAARQYTALPDRHGSLRRRQRQPGFRRCIAASRRTDH